jgi:hypothetical protein
VFVQHDTAVSAVLAQEILAHEYVHAQQDAERDLTTYTETYRTTTDSSVAVNSVFEGEARLYEILFTAHQTNHAPEDFSWDSSFTSGQKSVFADAGDVSKPIDDAFWSFPYVWGLVRAHDAWLKGGNAAVKRLFLSPPLAQNALLRPSTGLGPGLAIDDLTFTPPAGFAHVRTDTLGVLAVEGFLGRIGHSAVDAATWRGDRIDVFGDDVTGGTAVVWRIVLDDPTAATTIVTELGPSAPLPAGAAWQAAAKDATVTLVITDAPDGLKAWTDAVGL